MSGATTNDSNAEAASESTSVPDGLFSCAPDLVHGSVPRAEVASSLAAVLCITWEECCVEASPALSCRHGLNMGFEELDARAEALELYYDGNCVGYQQALIDAIACDVHPDTRLTHGGGCSIYYGRGRESESCEAVGTLGSTCRQGLICAAGQCVDPCAVETLGRPYAYGHGCALGDVVVGLDCREAVGGQTPCAGNCYDGFFCGDESLCEPTRPIGEPCFDDAECRESVCIEQHCAAGQPEGAPCNDGCGAQLSCGTASNTCVRDPYICQGAS